MSKAISFGQSKLVLPDLDQIAHEIKLIVRKSFKFFAPSFLQALLSSVATGLASLNQFAGDLKDRNHPGMARQSLHECFDIRSTASLMAVFGDLMQQRYSAAATSIGSSTMQRILIENAFGQVMPKSNADAFPVHGNHFGNTACEKIDFAFDLLTGTIVSHSLQAATEQDKSIGKEFIIEVRCGDLVLRDMGYFIIDEFTANEELGAKWLTCLPLTTGVVLDDGNTSGEYLKSFHGNIIDLDVIFGQQDKECRLVAMRAVPVSLRHGERNVAEKYRIVAKLPGRKDSSTTACASC